MCTREAAIAVLQKWKHKKSQMLFAAQMIKKPLHHVTSTTVTFSKFSKGLSPKMGKRNLFYLLSLNLSWPPDSPPARSALRRRLQPWEDQSVALVHRGGWCVFESGCPLDLPASIAWPLCLFTIERIHQAQQTSAARAPPEHLCVTHAARLAPSLMVLPLIRRKETGKLDETWN